MRELRPKTGPHAYQRQGFKDFCEWATTARDNELYIEIGSWQGESAEIAAGYFNHVICVDPWSETLSNIEHVYGYAMDAVFDAFITRTKPYSNITHLRHTSLDAVQYMKVGSASVVYIDGSHLEPNVLADARAWWPIVAQNGIFAGHDYDSTGTQTNIIGVKRAVDAIFRQPDKVFQDNTWAVDKTSVELGRIINL